MIQSTCRLFADAALLLAIAALIASVGYLVGKLPVLGEIAGRVKSVRNSISPNDGGPPRRMYG